jgi:ribosomal protein L24
MWKRKKSVSQDSDDMVNKYAASVAYSNMRLFDAAVSVTEKNNQIAKLKDEKEHLIDALKMVAIGIKRDRKMNACWLTGEAAVVHTIEETIKRFRVS